jgi:crotonobetainyl-CoA:carnitine CoA-transferase CaiB-like acyl-CoA transferase
MDKSDTLLTGVTAINAGRGLAGAIAGKMLRDLGAKVWRPMLDGPDPAELLYPAYSTLRAGEPMLDQDELADRLERADLFIEGGEDFPDHPAGPDIDTTRYPALIRLAIAGHPIEDAPASDTLAQARSGLTFEHYSNRANLMAFYPTIYGAVFQGLIGTLAALIARERGAARQEVATSIHEGALAWATTWAMAERATPAFNFTTPFDPRPLILRCADGRDIHIVMGSAGSKYHLYRILGIDDPTISPDDAGLPSRDDPPERFYGDVALIALYVARRDRDPLLAELTAAGIIAAPVLAPGECWTDAQVVHDGMVQPLPDGSAIIGPPAGILLCGGTGKPPAWSAPPASGRPLEGVRVIDFGAFTAGPLTSLALARLGADVVKVEPPTGDPCRNLIRAFMAANRGKRSIAVDMKTERGRNLAAELCASADIVVSNFRTGVSHKLGIDPASLLARHPHLIVLECPAFSSTGPRAQQVAFDPLMQALCGFEVRAGGEGNAPLWNRSFLADYGGGQIGSIMLLAGLLRRLRTGLGCALEVSLLRAAMVLQSEGIRRPDGQVEGLELLDPDQAGHSPADRLYRTADGWIAVSIRSEAAARAFAGVLGLVDLSPEWRRWRDAEASAIGSACLSWQLDDLDASLRTAGVPAARCQPHMETVTLSDRQFARRGIVEHVQTATFGKVSHVGSLFHLSAAPRPFAAAAPEIGEHDVAILSELGYDLRAIDALIRDRVVGAARAGLWS